MSKEYKGIEPFGQFNDTEIRAVVDIHGRYWFTTNDIASALQVDRSTVSRIRTNNLKEFDKNDIATITVDGKNQVVFSEEGFLIVSELSRSSVAYRLRKWIRQQFRVKRDEAIGIVVVPRAQERDDLSDIDPDFAVIQKLLDKAIANRRRIRALEAAKVLMETQQIELGERMEDAESKIQAFEDQNVINPGEMTALQLARHVRWTTLNGGAHNLAVILAAVNADFIQRKLIRKMPVKGPGGMTVNETVFTTNGVTAFKTEINSLYCTGQRFVIEPNESAKALGNKHKRNVVKA